MLWRARHHILFLGISICKIAKRTKKTGNSSLEPNSFLRIQPKKKKKQLSQKLHVAPQLFTAITYTGFSYIEGYLRFSPFNWNLCRTFLTLTEIKYLVSGLSLYVWAKSGSVLYPHTSLNSSSSISLLPSKCPFLQVFWICISLLQMAYAVAILVGLISPCLWSRVITVIDKFHRYSERALFWSYTSRDSNHITT